MLDPGVQNLFHCQQLPQLPQQRQEVVVNKGELVESMTQRSGLDKRQAEGALNAFVNAVMDAVKGGDRVAILGFGTFNPRSRSARTGRNPQTGAPVKIAASKSVGFAPGAAFKTTLNTKGGTKKAAPAKPPTRSGSAASSGARQKAPAKKSAAASKAAASSKAAKSTKKK
jgi:DNA-binding protein HU-beta